MSVITIPPLHVQEMRRDRSKNLFLRCGVQRRQQGRRKHKQKASNKEVSFFRDPYTDHGTATAAMIFHSFESLFGVIERRSSGKQMGVFNTALTITAKEGHIFQTLNNECWTAVHIKPLQQRQ